MTTKAFIQPDMAWGGISVVFVTHTTDGDRYDRYVTGLDPETPGVFKRIYISASDTSDRSGEIIPIRFTDGDALTLLEGLTRHFNGTEDTRQLRQDYNAERARVDKLINYLVTDGNS